MALKLKIGKRYLSSVRAHISLEDLTKVSYKYSSKLPVQKAVNCRFVHFFLSYTSLNFTIILVDEILNLP